MKKSMMMKRNKKVIPNLTSKELFLHNTWQSSLFSPPLLSTLLALAVLTCILPNIAQAKDTQLHLLTDPGLNSNSLSLLPFTQPNLGRWMQENAELVTGVQEDGVAPSSGDGMLAISGTQFFLGSSVSQVRQRIDVSHLADKIDQGLITAYAIGRVNASAAGVVGGTEISAGDSASGPSGTLGFGSGGERTLDGDPNTWESTVAYLPLSKGTRFVEYQFLFSLSSLAGGKIGYGDEAVLVLSEAPNPDIYSIGDTGPAGGIVFHITEGGTHGLEAAPEDQGTANWGCQGTLIGTNTTIDAGEINTASILTGCNEAGIAAELTDTYTLNGFSDWFLPSKDELKLLFLQKNFVSGITNDFYFSSSEITPFFSWVQKFDNLGTQVIKAKSFNLSVRAIRAF